MSFRVKSNFDWGITKRKLVIFTPNYSDSVLTALSISQIQTQIPEKDWIIIIGNDNVDVNWDHLKDKNVRYFTLLHGGVSPRNGGFIRNYAIKRCQSDLFFQKDGEVSVIGDFISKFIHSKSSWRSGNIIVLGKEVTQKCLEKVSFSPIQEYQKEYKDRYWQREDGTFECIGLIKISSSIPASAEEVKRSIIQRERKLEIVAYIQRKKELYMIDESIKVKPPPLSYHNYFHYAYGTMTKTLQDIRGYDERFCYYGYEDADMYCRLTCLKERICPDYSCTAIHPYHLQSIDVDKLKMMRQLFRDTDVNNPYRNLLVWGEGI